MRIPPKNKSIKNVYQTQINANPCLSGRQATQIYADNKLSNLRRSACNLRPSALKNIFPKKQLGQNFLADQNIRRKIVVACAFKPNDIVLEIGAGKGEMTALIAEQVKKLYALEIDKRLLPLLEGSLKEHANIKIINTDILKFNLNKITGKKIKVIGNIPYYISSPILESLFKFREKIETVFITVQKEFAERVVCAPGSKVYGSLSCFAQYYSQPRILFSIPKGCFYPIPKVDSSFLRLDIREKSPLSLDKEKVLFKVIRSAFQQRRKTLRNSLRGVIPPGKLEIFLRQRGLDVNIRPECLALEDFIRLMDF